MCNRVQIRFIHVALDSAYAVLYEVCDERLAVSCQVPEASSSGGYVCLANGTVHPCVMGFDLDETYVVEENDAAGL